MGGTANARACQRGRKPRGIHPLVLALQIVGGSTTATATATTVYFFVRAAHIVFYTFAVPLLRTVAFIIGVACQMTLALTLLQVI